MSDKKLFSESPLEVAIHREGKGFVLTSEVCLPRPGDEIFALFSDAFRLEELTPPWMAFHVVTKAPIAIQAGTRIDYRLRVHGIPMRWRSHISVWEPPLRFVDEQELGPYRYWRHEHSFEEEGEQTRVRDVVHYDVPLRALVHPLCVRRDLRRIFRYRQQKLSTLFGDRP
jgi:ligand-binding SRPBCC domain-containing protein